MSDCGAPLAKLEQKNILLSGGVGGKGDMEAGLRLPQPPLITEELRLAGNQVNIG